MTSLIPVASKTRSIVGDPFYVEPQPRPFYYPTAQRELTAKERKTVLSPERRSRPEGDEDEAQYAVDDKFLRGGNVFHHLVEEQSSGDRTFKFNESWPSSEHPSVLSDKLSPGGWWAAELGQHPVRGTALGEPLAHQRPAEVKMERGQPDTVLSKYIERFRYGAPQSRAQREQKQRREEDEFWWLKNGDNTPSPISTAASSMTPTSSSTPKDMDRPLASPQASPPLRKQEISRAPQRRVTKEDILTEKIQDRAARLLQMTDNSSTPPVSSLATGSSSSITPSSFDEQPFKPSFAKYLDKKEEARFFPVPPRSPEGDILQQWRLRRKVELTREKQKAHMVLEDPSLNHEVEAKLAAFRQRLARPKSVQAAPQIGLTGKPLYEQTESDSRLEEFRRKVGQVAMASDQSETVTDVDGITRLNRSPLRTEIYSNQNQTPPTHDYELRQSPLPSPIASPKLKRRDNAQDSIKPHYHLTCDLMPCPHSQGREVVQDKKLKSNPVQQESRTTGVSEIVARDIMGQSSSDDCERVTFLPNKQVQYCDKKNDGTVCYSNGRRQSDIGGNNHVMSSRPMRRDQLETKRSGGADIAGRSVQGQTVGDVVEHRATKTYKESGVAYGGARRKHYDEMSMRVNMGGQMHQSQSVSNSQCKGSEFEAGQQGAAGDGSKGAVFVQDARKRLSETAGDANIPSNVADTIEQVVRTRLFVDHEASNDVCGQRQQTQADAETCEEVSSDDEFSEDLLLTQLRQQRSVYEEQLRKIDRLLQEVEEE